MRKQNQVLLLFFFTSTFGISQNCYNVIADLTGIDNSTYLSQLETAACELKNTLPDEFKNDFAVFDFGFYTLTEYMDGSFQAMWDNKVVTKAESDSKFYVLFGKQLPDSKGQSKTWVKVKLPKTGSFQCFDQNFFYKIEYLISSEANKNLSTYQYFQGEVNALVRLTEIIDEIKDCCQPNMNLRNTECSLCTWKYSEIKNYYSQNSFQIDTAITINSNLSIDSSCICGTQYAVEYDKYVDGNIKLDKSLSISQFNNSNQSIDLNKFYNFLKEYGKIVSSSGKSFYGAVTDQSIFCSSIELNQLRSSSEQSIDQNQIQSNFYNSDVAIWFSILYSNEKKIVAIKTKGISIEASKWGSYFATKNPLTSELPQYFNTLVIMDKIEPAINFERADELYTLFNQGAGSCGGIGDWADLASFVIPASCQSKINGLGWENQDILSGNSKTVNLDRHSVSISILPDLNGDGIRSRQELYDSIRVNFPKFANGGTKVELDNWPDYSVVWKWLFYGGDFGVWKTNNPITTVINIDVSPKNAADSWGITDDATVICSSFDNTCCWVFSTIKTGQFSKPYNGSHPVSGNRQFGLTAVGSNYEFYIKAADRGRLSSLLKPGAWLTGNDMAKIFYTITDATWDNLTTNLVSYINSKGGQSSKNIPIIQRPDWAKVKDKLRSNAPITSIPCE